MSEGIVYQNKDILFKILGQTYKEKSFSAYGLDIPPIRELLPTNLPKISANEKSVDNLFLLEDGTYAIVDYESEFKKQNKVKYLNYIVRVMEKYYGKEKIEYGNQKTREIALKMLRRNIDIVDIMEVTGLTEEELLRLADENLVGTL